ncbi:MAG: S-layer protein [Candidatus Diapherotrites archaeon]|uniref:S-layer protein n=1 Tax=Candidatus Iainarchaeum sp. TaxID=3101447 RepID=A0A8T4L777_9ARCH|nr:S-layer protein [Candidatus Diapherotrites archaeon]
MKGLSIKKLAAVGIGAALVGTALAPIVSAISLTKSDLYDSTTGEPIVKVVAGADAGYSDWVWAGRIAAKLASKAYTTGTVSTSVAGGVSGGTATPTIEDVSAVFSLGRTLTIGGENVKSVKFDLNTGITTEFDRKEEGVSSGTDGIVTLQQGALPFLRKETVTKRVGNTTSDVTVEEQVQVQGDAKFNTDDEVEDLQFKIPASGVQYVIDLGDGLNAVESNGSAYLDDSISDRQELYFFGELYLIRKINRNTIGGTDALVELLRAASEKVYSEGDEITGLIGKGKYEGQEMKAVIGEGYAQGSTNVISIALYDAQGNLVDEDQFAAGDDEGVWEDENGDEVLRSGLFVQEINKRIDEGFQEIFRPTVIVGDNRIELQENRGFPFDEDDTDGIYDWDTSLVFSGDTDCTNTGSTAFCASGNPDNNTLQRVVITNEALTFDNDDSYLRDTGRAGGKFAALNPNRGFEKAVLKTDEGEPFIQVEYGGFETEVYRFLGLGRGPTDSIGYIDFSDEVDVRHKVPFYIPNLTTITAAGSGRVFTFDQGAQSYYYEANTSDTNLLVGDGNRLNGLTVDMNSNAGVGISIGTLGGGLDWCGANGASAPSASNFDVNDGEICNFDGISYVVQDANIGAPTVIRTRLTAKSSLRMIEGTAVSGTIYPDPLNSNTYQIGLTTVDTTTAVQYDLNNVWANYQSATGSYTCGNAQDNRLYLDDGNMFDWCPIRLEGLNDAKFEYVPIIVDQSGRSDFELILDDQNINTQEGGSLKFRGVSNPASATTAEDLDLDDITDATFYMIDDSVFGVSGLGTGHPKFNMSESDDAYTTAIFEVDEGEETQTTVGATYEYTVYVDTANDRLVDASNPERTLPTFEVSYHDTEYTATVASNIWTLRSDRPEIYMSKAFSDFGSLAETDGSRFTVFYPENHPESYLYVIGRGEVSEVETGGREYTVKEGETVTADDGTSITLSKISMGKATCAVTGGTGAPATCAATPSTYKMPARVPDTMVYVDSEAPVGTNIVVGGHIVNKLAKEVAGLADRLTKSGDMVAEVDAATGDIVVAGYTANDTGRAAQELIDAIDSLA